MALLTNINGKFSVSDAGAVTFNNAFTFPTTDGTANYVLKTNGSGTVSWSPDSSPTVYWAANGNDIYNTNSANVIIGDTTATSPNSADRFLKIGKSNLQDCSIILQDAVETWEIYQNDNLRFSFGTTPTTVMTMQRTTANVGIGTDSPDNKLDIALTTAAISFDTAIKVSANTDPVDYTANRGAGILFQNAEPYVAGIYGIRPTLGGWRGHLLFYTHTSASNNTFGTTFTEKMRITDEGKVGIGTASPDAKLEVESDQNSGFAGVFVKNISNGASAFVFKNWLNDDSGFGQIWRNSSNRSSAGQAASSFNMYNSADINFWAGADHTMALVGSNVGIGTVSPDEKLDVENGNIRLKSNSDGNTGIFRMYDASGTESGQIYPAGGDLKIYSPNDILFTQTGKVGIGTTSPGAKLEVTTSTAGFASIIQNTNGASDANGLLIKAGTVSSEYSLKVSNSTDSTNFMVVKGNGNVGIGTVSPASSYGFSKTLEIQGAANAEINISQSNNSKDWSLGIVNGANYQQTTSGQQYIWLIGGSEKMRISNTGNVGIGETSPTNGKLQIKTSSAVAFSPTVFTSGANLRLQTGGTATAGITTGISMGVGGSAEAYIGAVQNVSNYADIVFQTYHGAYGERMRITSAGDVTFAATLTTGGSAVINGNQTTTGNFTLNGNQTILRTTPTITLEGRNSGNSGAKLQFLGWANTHDNWELGNGMAGQGFQFRASATAGSTNFSTVAVINSGTGVYTATSDINKKKDFEDSEIGLKEVMKLKPKLFRMKTENENSDKHLGFIAQEVKKVIPQAYLEENGENDEKFIGLQDRPIIAALTKAIQELKAEIEILKNK